jgi:hypothetical protein
MISGRYTYEEGRTVAAHARLTPATRVSLDALLQPAGPEGTGDAEDGTLPGGRVDAPLIHLRGGPGRASVASLRDELARLGAIRRIGLPADLFTDWSLQDLEACRQRGPSRRPMNCGAILMQPAMSGWPPTSTCAAVWLC